MFLGMWTTCPTSSCPLAVGEDLREGISPQSTENLKEHCQCSQNAQSNYQVLSVAVNLTIYIPCLSVRWNSHIFHVYAENQKFRILDSERSARGQFSYELKRGLLGYNDFKSRVFVPLSELRAFVPAQMELAR